LYFSRKSGEKYDVAVVEMKTITIDLHTSVIIIIIIIIIKAIYSAQDPLKKAANALTGSEKM